MAISPANIYAIAPELRPGVPQTQTITFSIPLVTGNIIAGTVGGIYTVSVPFNTTNSQTLTDLAARIALFPVIASSVSNGTNQVTITGAQNGINISVALAVTGGVTQPTIALNTTIYPIPGLITQTQINAAIANAVIAMGDPCIWGDLYDLAQAYLAAHLLALINLRGRLGVTSEAVGGISRGYMSLSKPNDQAYYLTGYGTQFLAYRDMLIITPISSGFGPGLLPYNGFIVGGWNPGC